MDIACERAFFTKPKFETAAFALPKKERSFLICHQNKHEN